MNAPIVLTKGGRINLSKQAPNLKNIRAELRWSPNDTDTGHEFDLDLSIFVNTSINGKSQLVANDHFVFYNNLQTPDGSVKRTPDDLTGERGGEDAFIELPKLSGAISEIVFVITIHDASVRKQNFGQVPKSSIVLFDADTGSEVARYNLGDDFSTETAVEVGSIYRRDDNAWGFKAVGTGFNSGLIDFVTKYGGKV